MEKVNCVYCRKSISERNVVSCKSCELVFYCGEECYMKNKKEHDEWCMDVQLYMLTKEEYNDGTSKFEIDVCDVNNESMTMSSQALYKTFITPVNISLHTGVINNWKDYFRARNYATNPILCSALQWVMTTYSIIRQYFEEYGMKESLKIHFLGAEMEVQYMDTFAELENLFPGLRLECLFIGPNVDKGYINNVFETQRVKCSVLKGIYHQIKQLDKPDLIIGFNAGLPSYLTWVPTIQHLKKQNIPSYFTEYCWRGYHLTLLRLSLLDGVTLSQGNINQFKSFIRITDKSTKIPQFSNQIIFKLTFL